MDRIFLSFSVLTESRNLFLAGILDYTCQVCNCENTEQSKTNSVSGDHPKFQLKISPKTRSTEVGSPLVMETDENVEKAEAYTKELEDVSKLRLNYFCYELLLCTFWLWRSIICIL